MKTKSPREFLSLIVAFSLIFSFSFASAKAQQSLPNDDETLIKEARTELQTLTANAASPGSASESAFKISLLTARQKLRDLLLQKKGALRSKIGNLQASAKSAAIANYLTALQTELGDVESELRELDQALMQTGVVIVSSVAPQPSPSPVPSPPSAQETAFTTQVKNLMTQDLTKTGAPAEVAGTELPQGACNDNGFSTLQNPSRFESAICSLAARLAEQRDDQLIHLSTAKTELLPIMIAKLLKTQGTESYVAFVTEAQEARIDQQVGAGPSSPGTTSLVVKGGVPYFFGLAVENGAATQSQSDTTITYRVNPAGMLNMFAKKGFITGFQQNEKEPLLKFLGKTSLGFTFDTSRGSEPGVFTGDKQQLSAFSARVEFVNERDPRLQKYERVWEEFVANDGVMLGKQLWATTLALNDWGAVDRDESFRDPALQAWLEQTKQLLADVDRTSPKVERINQLARIIRARVDLLPVDLVSDDTVTAVTNFAKQFIAYTEKKNELLDRIAKGKIFTLEYTNNRGASAPDTSNFNFIAATGIGAKVDVTANGSFTFFNKRPLVASSTSPRPGRVRDFQFAGQVSIPFKIGDGQFDFWFSGRYERLLTDASTMAGTTMPGTQGDIAVGQFGLNIPIPSLGIKFPVSFTFANRTELVKEKEIRGNFGFTFNWDTLFSKINPF